MTSTKLVSCPNCSKIVKLNGIGSNRNALQRVLTSALQTILPFTSDKFREASEWHDMAVHQGCPEDIPFNIWVKSVDGEFHSLCLAEARKSNWFGRLYYKKQADGLKEALDFNGGKGYSRMDCVKRLRIIRRGNG